MSPDQAPVRPRLRVQVSRLLARAWEPAIGRRRDELTTWLGLAGLGTDEVERAERMRRRGRQPAYVADRILAARARAARSRAPGYRTLVPLEPDPEPLPVRRWALRLPQRTHGWSITWSAGRSPAGARAVLRWGAPEHRPGASTVDRPREDHTQDGDFVHVRVIREPRSLRPGEHPGIRRPGAAT